MNFWSTPSFQPMSWNHCSHHLFHSGVPLGVGRPAVVKRGEIGSVGDDAGGGQLMHELSGLSTGPFRRPFQPRWVGGRSSPGLTTVSFRSLLMGVAVIACGAGNLPCESSTGTSLSSCGSLPHIRPTGARFCHGSLLARSPLYWNVP